MRPTRLRAAAASKVPEMNVLLLSFQGTILVVKFEAPGALSRRLAALRAWPSERNYPTGQ
jgi:hypothetical protein